MNTAFSIGHSLDSVHAAMAAYRWKLLGVGILVVGVASGIGWFLTGWLLKPLREISKAARDIAHGQRNEVSLPAHATVEVADLTEALNLSYRQLNQMIEQQIQFSADASHELRTPVAAILSQADLALRGERDPTEYRRAFEITRSAADRMRILISNLLELSRYNRGQFDFTYSICSLSGIAEGCIDWLGGLADDKGIVLDNEIEDSLIHADARRVEQVLINLLGNAIRHTPSDGTIRLTAERDRNPGFIRVSVIDTGEGIPADDIPKLFDRFTRLDKSREDGSGYGLGLAICFAIVEAHGGKIGAESVPGGGSTFWFTVKESG